MAARKTIKSQEEKQETNALIYCGPSLPRGALQQFAVFRNGLPKHLDEHLEKCKAMKGLFVTPDRLTETRTKVQIKGTRENMLFTEALAYAGRDR